MLESKQSPDEQPLGPEVPEGMELVRLAPFMEIREVTELPPRVRDRWPHAAGPEVVGEAIVPQRGELGQTSLTLSVWGSRQSVTAFRDAVKLGFVTTFGEVGNPDAKEEGRSSAPESDGAWEENSDPAESTDDRLIELDFCLPLPPDERGAFVVSFYIDPDIAQGATDTWDIYAVNQPAFRAVGPAINTTAAVESGLDANSTRWSASVYGLAATTYYVSGSWDERE